MQQYREGKPLHAGRIGSIGRDLGQPSGFLDKWIARLVFGQTLHERGDIAFFQRAPAGDAQGKAPGKRVILLIHRRDASQRNASRRLTAKLPQQFQRRQAEAGLAP